MNILLIKVQIQITLTKNRIFCRWLYIFFSRIYKYIKQMRFGKGIKEILYKADFFHSASLLRIKKQPQHRTLLGGAISVSIMIILIATFYNKIIDTLDKVVITSSSYTSNAEDPLPFNLTTYDGGHFMFGVEVWHFNLNEGPRYFDVVLTNTIYTYGEPQNTSILYKLEPCTREHWNGYPSVQAQFQPLNMHFWKCPPKNTEFLIKGKYSSKDSMTLNVALMTCTNRSDEDRPCAPQQEIDAFFLNNPQNFYTIYFLNALINPQKETVLDYYLQDVNYIIFTPNVGAEGILLVEDFTIQTDESILPNQNILTEAGGIIRQAAIKNVYSDVADTYATFIFFKSGSSNFVKRSFDKLDTVLSYIGGLFGTILIFFFVIGSYNTYKFQVNLAGYLYRAERDKKERTDGEKDKRVQREYNFGYFLGQSVYALLGVIGFRPKWEKVGQYHRTREEMLKQLDILFLLKRVNFLQHAISFLFSDHQLKGLHLASQPTMADAAKTRRNYKLKHKLKNKIEAIEKAQSLTFNNHQHVSKNTNSKEFMSFQNLEPPKAPIDKQLVYNDIYHTNQDNYSSEDYSSSSQEQDQITFIRRLSKDVKNETSIKIWKNVDTRIKNSIQKDIDQPNNIISRKSSETGKNNYNSSQIDQNSFVVENNFFDNQIAKEMFSNLKILNAQQKSQYYEQQKKE